MKVVVYIRRTPREREVERMLGNSMTINREVEFTKTNREKAIALAELGLVEIRKKP